MTRLEFERRRRGWNQTELAFYSKTTQGEISQFERRRQIPSPVYANRIARVLGVLQSALLEDVVAVGPGEHEPHTTEIAEGVGV